MRAHLVQTNIVWEDKAANFERTKALVGEAAPSPGDLIVLAEMFDTGFSFNLATTADRDGRTLAFLQSLAREFRVTVHGGRTLIGPEGKGRNMATVVGPDGTLLAEYAKIHPFSFGRESEHFLGGDRVLTYSWHVQGRGLTVCPAVCYDLRFPEVFRLGLDQGAEVFAIGSNWPRAREEHRRVLSIARAIENQAFVLSVNRTGRDPTLEYAGGTLAVDPQGRVLGALDEREGVLSVEIDPELVTQWRATFPAWKDRKLTGRLA